MNRKIAPMFYTAVVLLSITLVFFMGGGMTGMAVTDLSEKPLGTYEIYPNLKTDVGFSFEQYKELRIDSRKLLDSVSACADSLDSCIQQGIKTIDLDGKGWRLGCKATPDEFFYSLAAHYKSCSESPDNDCICVFDLTHKLDEGKYSVTLKPLTLNTVMESEGVQSLEIPDVEPQVLVGEGLVDHIPAGDQVITAVYAAGGFERAYVNIKGTDYDPKDQLIFYKIDKAMVIASAAYASKPSCAIKEERTRIFCVTSPESVVASGSQQPLVYRFALQFP
jgi:hypothetical protein